MQVGVHSDKRDRLAGSTDSRGIQLTGKILSVGHDVVLLSSWYRWRSAMAASLEGVVDAGFFSALMHVSIR